MKVSVRATFVAKHNKYPGVCYLCSLYVAAGEGRFERKLGGWRVRHVRTGKGTTCEMAQKKAEKIQAILDDEYGDQWGPTYSD